MLSFPSDPRQDLALKCLGCFLLSSYCSKWVHIWSSQDTACSWKFYRRYLCQHHHCQPQISKSPKHFYQLMLLTTWPRSCGWTEATLPQTPLLWGFPACTGNGEERNQDEGRVLQLSANQRADCPFVLSFAGYLYQRDRSWHCPRRRQLLDSHLS